MRSLFLGLLMVISTASAQVKENAPASLKGNWIPNTKKTIFDLTKDSVHQFSVNLEAKGQYEFYITQYGIDILARLTDPEGKKILDQDSPNGSNGPENFDYIPSVTGTFKLSIFPLDDSGNAVKGKYTLVIKKLNQQQILDKEKTSRELEIENNKNVQTLDIDHFWDAYDHLVNCKNFEDSVASFQDRYIYRATSGFKDFLMARNFTAEEYVRKIRKFPKFYQSIRKNTYEVKKAEPLIEEVFRNFKSLYPNFKPFKVCFAIGTIRTGGTTSDKFVLIGTEMTTCTAANDLSEFNGDAMGKVLAGESDVVQKIKNIVAHECVHTQQKNKMAPGAEKCDLLYACMQEGFCDFIGELVAGNQINKVAATYGDAHETELWKAFKSELCSKSISNWLYNYSTVKDKPADLGYYIGYRIARQYYQQHANKQQAIIDIIEMDDPKQFLTKSGYDEHISDK